MNWHSVGALHPHMGRPSPWMSTLPASFRRRLGVRLTNAIALLCRTKLPGTTALHLHMPRPFPNMVDHMYILIVPQNCPMGH